MLFQLKSGLKNSALIAYCNHFIAETGALLTSDCLRRPVTQPGRSNNDPRGVTPLLKATFSCIEQDF
jgi:hypothetical protein